MKTILMICLSVIILSVSACKKDEEAKTTYQITNNSTLSPTEVPYLDGTMWEIVVYCYIGTDIVRQDNIVSVAPAGGQSAMIEVPNDFEKVKVSFKLLPPASEMYDNTLNHRYYVVAYTVLAKGTNNLITVTDHTQVGTSLSMTENIITMGQSFGNAKVNMK